MCVGRIEILSLLQVVIHSVCHCVATGWSRSEVEGERRGAPALEAAGREGEAAGREGEEEAEREKEQAEQEKWWAERKREQLLKMVSSRDHEHKAQLESVKNVCNIYTCMQHTPSSYTPVPHTNTHTKKESDVQQLSKSQRIEELERQLKSVDEELKTEKQKLLSVQEVCIFLDKKDVVTEYAF